MAGGILFVNITTKYKYHTDLFKWIVSWIIQCCVKVQRYFDVLVTELEK